MLSLQESVIAKYYNENKDKFTLIEPDGLYKSGDNENGHYLFVHKGSVEYFARYKRVNYTQLANLHMLRQVLVLRFNHSVMSVDIPRKIFFNYLLPTFGSIVTDIEQTTDCRKHWAYALAYALDRKDRYAVSILDRRSTPNKVIEIEDRYHFDREMKNIWNTEQAFNLMSSVISLI